MLHRFSCALLTSLFVISMGDNVSYAQDFWENNFLVDIYSGSYRSSVADDLSIGGYELSGGEFVRLSDWYSPNFPDTTILFLKQVSPDFGIIWGLSTGETGEKYKIEPALQLGFLCQYIPFDTAVLSIKATYPFFGAMTEGTCTADYVELGGIQTVNCRLAADIIPPEETLDHLVNIGGDTDAKISVSFSLAF
jgi:hypothetical protein